MSLPKMLTSGEVRDAFGVSRPTLRRLIDSGELPATKVGPHYRFWPEDVRLYLDRNRIRSISPDDAPTAGDSEPRTGLGQARRSA